MKEQTNPRLKALIIEIVNNQLMDNDPPFVKETLNRLTTNGWNESKAKEAIAAAVLGEMYYTLKDHVPFDTERYHRELKALK